MCRPILKYSLYTGQTTDKYSENSYQCHSIYTETISVIGLHNDNKHLMDKTGMQVCWSATFIPLVNCI